jgi:hypothetical protein
LLKVNTTAWVIHKEKRFIEFRVLRAGEFKIKKPHLAMSFLQAGPLLSHKAAQGITWQE